MKGALSIKLKLGVIIGSFLGLMVLYILLTLWNINKQESDSRVMNMAGKQRMLTQKMTKEAMSIFNGTTKKEELVKTVELFDKSLVALIDGDSKEGIPITKDAEIVAQLEKVRDMWKEFKSNIIEAAEHTEKREELYNTIIADNAKMIEKTDKIASVMVEEGVSRRLIYQVGRLGVLLQEIAKKSLMFDKGLIEKEQLLDTMKKFDAILSGLIDGAPSMGIEPVRIAAVRGLVKELGNDWKVLKKNLEDFIVQTSEIKEHRAYIMANNMPLMVEMNKAVGLFEEVARAKVKRLVLMEIVLFLVGIVMVIVGYVIAVRFIARPVTEATEMALAISRGHLNVPPLAVTSNDEIGTLRDALNRMKDNLKQMISKIRSTSENIASASHELAASSSQIVKGADRQSAQTNQVATAMEEMSASVIEVAKNSQDASQYAARTHDIAQKGGEIVDKAVAGMLNVADTVKKSATTVEALGKSSEEIGHIVAVINDIADQTNLLALNAAIEAARAGEQGRGFAVVADEVRKLAEKTTKATKEIKDMIESIQKETGDAINSMHNGTKQVEEGVALAKEAGDALRSIVASVEKVSDMVRQIATAAEEQSATTEEISQNISAIAGISVETADGVKQISYATDEMSKIAEQLRKLVETFHIEDSTENTSGATESEKEDGDDREDSSNIIKVVGGQ